VKCQPVLEDYYECLHHKKEVRTHILMVMHYEATDVMMVLMGVYLGRTHPRPPSRVP
jgi:hypothetical protein